MLVTLYKCQLLQKSWVQDDTLSCLTAIHGVAFVYVAEFTECRYKMLIDSEIKHEFKKKYKNRHLT